MTNVRLIIFKAMHAVLSVLKSLVTFATNTLHEAKLLIRCTGRHEAGGMDAHMVAIKFDDKLTIHKVLHARVH